MCDCFGSLGHLNKRISAVLKQSELEISWDWLDLIKAVYHGPDPFVLLIFHSALYHLNDSPAAGHIGYNLIITCNPPYMIHCRHVLYIKTEREQNLIRRSIKLTLSPAACFSACAARWGRRAAGWGTRWLLWWETPSRRCNRNPGPGGRLHLGEESVRVWSQCECNI